MKLNVSEVFPSLHVEDSNIIGPWMLGADLYWPRCSEYSADFQCSLGLGSYQTEVILPDRNKFGKSFLHQSYFTRAVWGFAPSLHFRQFSAGFSSFWTNIGHIIIYVLIVSLAATMQSSDNAWTPITLHITNFAFNKSDLCKTSGWDTPHIVLLVWNMKEIFCKLIIIDAILSSLPLSNTCECEEVSISTASVFLSV